MKDSERTPRAESSGREVGAHTDSCGVLTASKSQRGALSRHTDRSCGVVAKAISLSGISHREGCLSVVALNPGDFEPCPTVVAVGNPYLPAMGVHDLSGNPQSKPGAVRGR
jgi:hypothetical protein